MHSHERLLVTAATARQTFLPPSHILCFGANSVITVCCGLVVQQVEANGIWASWHIKTRRIHGRNKRCDFCSNYSIFITLAVSIVFTHFLRNRLYVVSTVYNHRKRSISSSPGQKIHKHDIDLCFVSPQPDTSSHCETADTAGCLLTPQLRW